MSDPTRDRDPVATAIETQRVYYEARAGEYDEWWLRQGRYDRGPDANGRWFAEVAEAQTFFDNAGFQGEILELAPGTGVWTERLARYGSVTAVDTSAAMIAINQAKLARQGLTGQVRFLTGDLFAWTPDRLYDAVFAGFFLSHVPDNRLDDIIGMMARALRPGGLVGLIDGRHQPLCSTDDQPLEAADAVLMTRRLNDGRAFEIVKRHWQADELIAAFDRHGVALRVRETATYFLYALGTTSRGH